MHKLTVVGTWLITILFTQAAAFYFVHVTTQARYINHLLNSPEKIISMAPSQALSFAALPKSEEAMTAEVSHKDARAFVVQQFLGKYGSPLAEHAEFMVEVSDKYGLPDFRILPAIAMQESNGCRKLPEVGGAYNCWGYGIYGKVSLGFDSYESAIDRVARGLKQDYYDKGLTTPYQIMTRYTPPSIAKGGPWARGVEYFMNEMR